MGNDTVTTDGDASPSQSDERLSGARLEAAVLQVIAMAQMVRDLPLAELARAIPEMAADADTRAGARARRMAAAELLALGELVDPLLRFQSRAKRVSARFEERRPAQQSSVRGPAHG